MDEDLYGTDLQMTMDGDLDVAPGGDLASITDIPNLNQAIANRTLTTPQEYLFGDGAYGCTLKQYIDAIIGATEEAEIQQDMSASLIQDPRIASVTGVVVTQDASTGALTVVPSVVTAFGDTTGLGVTT